MGRNGGNEVQDFLTVQEFPTCDKCGQPVEPQNDAVVFDFLMVLKQSPYLQGVPQAMWRLCQWKGAGRHLIPTGACEGSPSRAQYLEGQEPDPRGYRIHPELTDLYREVYAEQQEAYAEAKAE